MMTGPETIGIMADSHGNADAIRTAIDFFQKEGCRRIVHLGDICDSVACDSADTCVGLLKKHAVLAVKGNNDHAVVKNRAVRHAGCVSSETAAYLAALPLQLELSEALFVHSRPFADTLGLSAMTGDIEKDAAARFLACYPGKILFRGHGHSPRVTGLNHARYTTVDPASGESLQLDGKQAWIVTCGALYKGLCMIWTPGTGAVVSHKLVS
ncbi:MAG: metallophosphoesterase family protein [Desulfobacterales bacterium]|nr:metallophosphoesterase family protein [Desulfobacterales bacterium]